MLGSSFLRYLCLLAYSGVQHILCYVFVLFVFLLCTLCCQFLWIFLFCLSSSCVPYVASFPGLSCFVCLPLVYPMLPVSLDFPVLFVFLLYTLCCQFPWIVHFWVPLRYSLTFINTSEIERKLTLRLILLIDWFCRSLFFLLSAITPLASSNSFHCLMLSIYIHDENKCSNVYNLYRYEEGIANRGIGFWLPLNKHGYCGRNYVHTLSL